MLLRRIRGAAPELAISIGILALSLAVPKPSDAAIVNGYDALLARARQCQAERGKRPNVIAVDFYRTGDLFRVARALNEPDGP